MKQIALLIKPQPFLKTTGLIVLLAIANTIVPLSLDMYTPAIPSMTQRFQTSAALVNLTLLGFFLFYAIGLLVFGPLSDKLGRKPLLLLGMISYTAGSVLCALSISIEMLIVSRLVEALGAGAITAVSTALVKDCFSPAIREKILAILQVIAVIGPVAAPLIGGFIIQHFEWEVTFWVLSVIGALCTIASIFFKESLDEQDRITEGVGKAIAQLKVVASNKGFSLFLIAAAMINIPFMAYVAVASYVYIDFFGLDAQLYGICFSIAALGGILGPLIYLRLSKHILVRPLTYLFIGAGIVTGALTILVGSVSPAVFCLMFVLMGLIEAALRPYTTNILLSQNEKDTGSASSLINFTHTALGCIGMAVITLFSQNYIFGIGILSIVSMAIALAILLGLTKSSIKIKYFNAL